MKTEQHTRTVERQIRGAFRQFSRRRVFQTVYEHGQWWVICEDFHHDDEGAVTFSVQDCGPGPWSFDGFSFERV